MNPLEILTNTNLHGIARKVKDYRLLSFYLELNQDDVIDAQTKNEVYREDVDIAFTILEVI